MSLIPSNLCQFFRLRGKGEAWFRGWIFLFRKGNDSVPKILLWQTKMQIEANEILNQEYLKLN